MDSFEEIIQFAINHEESEAAFYRDMAARTDSVQLKEALLAHAREEDEHKRHLENILASHRLPSGGRRFPDPDLKIADYHVLPRNQQDQPLTYQDALLMAAKREQSAERLYQDMAAKTQDPEAKKTFLFLAEQEGKHRHALETEYDQEILDEG